MDKKSNRSSFTGSLGFVLAAAGSAVGLGNIWRFPYLAAKDGGGVFLLVYLILALTFGFTLLTTEIAIGRKTKQSALTAYGALHPKMSWIGLFASIVPALIIPYYCAIGGWILKFMGTYLTGGVQAAAGDKYFVQFITSPVAPLIWFLIYVAATVFIVYKGVDKGIEKLSKILMPLLFVLICGIAIFSMTLSHTDASGVTRTGWEGFLIYIIPDFTGMTLQKFMVILVDAMGQLFFSISVAMGIMVTYGSYVKKETNLVKSVNRIEICDTGVAFLAGLMIIPAVFVFMGHEGLANSGTDLMFKALPKVFNAMGPVLGTIIGSIFFITVAFAALTSSVSLLETIVASVMDKFHLERKKAVIYCGIFVLIAGLIVCFGYTIFYFDAILPNTAPGKTAQILDILDYASNSVLMPIVAIATCILVGWMVKPKTITDEVTLGKIKFSREKLYVVMIKYVTPIMLFILLLSSTGILKF